MRADHGGLAAADDSTNSPVRISTLFPMLQPGAATAPQSAGAMQVLYNVMGVLVRGCCCHDGSLKLSIVDMLTSGCFI